MKLVIGLGNPGKEYERTRHNAGFLVVGQLARAWGVEGKAEARFQAMVGEGRRANQKVLLVQPTTFMNLSGRAVRALTDFYKVPTDDLVVVYDDVDLPLGTIRVRTTGSAGGQNGVASIIQELGTNRFPRVRVGIGPLTPGWTLTNFVLGRFQAGEEEALAQGLKLAQEAIEEGLARGWEPVMNRFNTVGKKVVAGGDA